MELEKQIEVARKAQALVGVLVDMVGVEEERAILGPVFFQVVMALPMEKRLAVFAFFRGVGARVMLGR